MNHEFEFMTVSISVHCRVCEQIVESRKGIARTQMGQFNILPEKLAGVTAERAYRELAEHDCPGPPLVEQDQT